MLHAYLTFNGNCRQAMQFYQECLEGNLYLQALGELPESIQLPSHMKERILHAYLSHDNLVLMGSDMVPENGLMRGNAVALILTCETEAETRTRYDRLASGGVRNHPLQHTFWGTLAGDLTDKFGNHWMLTCQENA
jgi:PhnB protein